MSAHAPLSTSARRRRPISIAAGALCLVLLAGCGGGGVGDLVGGGGGGGGGGGPSAVSIQTTSLPSGGIAVPYSVALDAAGGVAPYAWTLATGSPPPGIALASGGALSGTPTTLGSFSFGVRVTDAGAATAIASYTIVVSAFDASIALLHVGEAWTDEGYPLSATGGSGTTFTLVLNQSGASIANAAPATSTARYVAGSVSGADRIRATSSTGLVEDIDVVVRSNPVGGLVARFSSTDVWYLKFEGKFDGTHAHASDFDRSMAILGLRSTSSTGATGTTAEELAKLYVRQQTLRYLNTFYGNDAAGGALSGGLSISFPFLEPDDPHVSPAAGAISNPAYNQFNVISMIAGDSSGVIGTAWLDEPSNDSQENDTTTSRAGSLGVFVDEIASFMNGPYGNTQLTAAPIGSGDVAALQALLYGTASPGGRYAEIQRIAQGYGRTLAAVAAHEIGHSLGLDHTSPTQSGSIMNPAAQISPAASYHFTNGALTILAGGLPGPGRGGSPQFISGQSRFASPGEGELGFAFEVCGCRVHHR